MQYLIKNFRITQLHHFMWVRGTLLLLRLSRFSLAQLCVTPLTVARQAPLSMGFSRQEYWRGLPCPPPLQGILRTQGWNPPLLTSPALVSRQVLYPSPPGKPPYPTVAPQRLLVSVTCKFVFI